MLEEELTFDFDIMDSSEQAITPADFADGGAIMLSELIKSAGARCASLRGIPKATVTVAENHKVVKGATKLRKALAKPNGFEIKTKSFPLSLCLRTILERVESMTVADVRQACAILTPVEAKSLEMTVDAIIAEVERRKSAAVAIKEMIERAGLTVESLQRLSNHN